MELSQVLTDRRLIRVLIAPIGQNSLFNEHFQLISSVNLLAFEEIVKPNLLKGFNPLQQPTRSIFKYLNWAAGEILFDYLRYDRVPAGPGDFDNFQSSKRIMVVIGLINYPEFKSTRSIDEEIEKISKRYPYTLLKRVLVFNFNFDSGPCPIKALKNDPDSLVIFPPNMELTKGSNSAVVHFKEAMCLATGWLVQKLERLMDICEDARLRNIIPGDPTLTTMLDDRDDLVVFNTKEITHSNIPAMTMAAVISASASAAAYTRNKRSYRKKPSGRLRKFMGDLAMQVCSPVDAIENYVAAILESRAVGDNLWLAGALDGYSSAIVLLKHLKYDLESIIGNDLKTIAPPPPPSKPADEEEEAEATLPALEPVYALIIERANEATSIYSSSNAVKVLEVECHLRIARLLQELKPFLLQEQMVLEYLMKAIAVQGLSSQQQIDCALEGALICHRLGLRRKYALLLYIASLMTGDLGNREVACELVRRFKLRDHCPQRLTRRANRPPFFLPLSLVNRFLRSREVSEIPPATTTMSTAPTILQQCGRPWHCLY